MSNPSTLIRQTVSRVGALLFCLALAGSSFAEQLPIRIYTSADGLGSGFVDCVFLDTRGFMWFCTRDGLSRFDGSQFVTYRVGDKDSPPGIEHISQNRDGTYWLTTTIGMYRFKGDSLSRPETTKDGKPFINAEFVSDSRGFAYEDPAGQLWYGGGVFARMIEQDGKVHWQEVPIHVAPHPQSPFEIVQIVDANDGSKWLLSNVGLIRYLPDGRTVHFPHPSSVRQGSITMVLNPNGNVWVAWGTDIFVIKPEPIASLKFETSYTRQLIPTSTVEIESKKSVPLPTKPGEILRLTKKTFTGLTMRMGQTTDGHVWLVSNDELVEFDGGRFHTYSTEHGLPNGMAEFAEDNAGNVWIGGRGGLTRLDRKGLTKFGPGDGLKSQAIFAVNESRDGKLYVANGDYYLSTFDGEKFVTVRPNLDADARPLWTSRYAFLSSKNEWWILTTNKLYRFSANNLRTPIKTYTAKDGFKDNQMFQIFEDSHDNIWLSLQPDKLADRGLYVLKPGQEKFVGFSEEDGYPQGKSAVTFAEDRSGNLWLGFYEGGLARYRDGRFQVFTTNDGLPRSVTIDLLVDQKGRLWIATVLGGLRRIDDPNADKPNLVPLTIEHGLSSNNVRTIVDDLNGNIYAGTVRGIDQIALDTQRVKHYSIKDGLASDFVLDSLRDRNGTLWFATTNGLSRLVPRTEEPIPPPTVWLGGLRIAGEIQPVAELGTSEIQKGDLSHTRNNFQIDFFGISFRPGDTLRYQFMLEGADRDWSPATELHSVTYANLRPGSYRFLVRAVNSDGVVSQKPAVVSFRILPPLYLRWWFITLGVIAGLTIIYLVYRYRLARLHEVNEALLDAKLAEEKLRKAREEKLIELESVRKRIATDLHDDIGSSLTRISLLSEVTQLQGRSVETPSGGSLSVIAGLSRELVDSMSDIVWAINPEKDSLTDLTQRMRHFASDVFTARGINFRFRFPDAEQDLKVNASFRRELFLIFKEAVNNAVRHSGCTEAEVEFRMDNDGVLLRLTDNGHGFDVQNKSSGHGLMSMKSRIESFSGKLDVVSNNSSGTTLTFTIPQNGFAQKVVVVAGDVNQNGKTN